MLKTVFLCALITFQQLVMCTETTIDQLLQITATNKVEIEHKNTIPCISLPCIAYSPDGTMLAIGYSDNIIKLLDAKTYALISTLEDAPSSDIQRVIFSPDGKTLACLSGSSRINTWHLMADGQVETREIKFQSPIDHMVFKENDKIILLINQDKIGCIQSIAQEKSFNWETFVNRNEHEVISSFALHPQDKTLAVGVHREMFGIDFYDADHKRGHTFDTKCINKIQYTPDGSKLIGTSCGDIIILDIEKDNTHAFHKFTAHLAEVEALAISPDSKILASACDKTIKLRNLVTNGLLHTIETGYRTVRELAFNPAGTRLATASYKANQFFDITDIKTIPLRSK